MSSIVRHRDSIDHRQASSQMEKEKVAEMLSVEPDCEQTAKFETLTCSNDDRILFNTVYYAAKSQTPSKQVNSLLALQSMNGLELKYKNLSWDSITEIQRSIVHVLTKSLVSDIISSPVYAIMLDESTDITVVKRITICVRYVKAGEAVTKFLCNDSIENGKSHTIVNCVASKFEECGIDMTKCVSLSTDGAAAMMGKHTGVGKQIEAKYSPFCVQTHCVAHRLNLACVDSIKKDEYLVKFKDKFNSLYYFMSASSIRTSTLKNIQRLLEEPELSIKQPHSIHWLGLKNAVEAVYECYSSVLTTLSKFAAEKCATAKGLYKYFNNYKVALVTAFMLDVHSELARLSCSFQKQNLLFSELKPLMDGTIASLQFLESKDGGGLKEMRGRLNREGDQVSIGGEHLTYKKTMDAEFEKLRAAYVLKVVKNLRSRFKEEDSKIFTDFGKVFEPLTVNSVANDESVDAISHLGDLYGIEKTVCVIDGNLTEGMVRNDRAVQPLLDSEKLLQEWPRLRGMIQGAYAKLETDQLCKRLILLHGDTMPNCAKLATIALCLQLTSVECERSFSSQNRLKNKFRASLQSEKLDHLMKVAMLGPPFESYDPCPAICHWSQKRRRKRRLCWLQSQTYKSAKICLDY